MYAVIDDNGTQIKVSEGDVIKIALRELPAEAATITFDRVLAVGGVDEAKIGTPVVEGAKVTADVLGLDRMPRVPVVKFKRRKTYIRRKSHRQDYLKVKVTAIEA